MAKNFIFTEIYDFNKLKYTLSQETTITSLDQVKVYEDDEPLTIKRNITIPSYSAVVLVNGYYSDAK